MPERLTEFYSDEGPERIGFVFKDGSIAEVVNVYENPLEGASIAPEDLLEWLPHSSGLWHTHPGKPSNLTVQDMRSFKAFPDHAHYIVGQDGIAKYVVDRGEVIRCA